MSSKNSNFVRNNGTPPGATPPDLVAIGGRIAEVRKALGWSSQDMAAQHLDNSGKTMWNIENGKTLPSTEMLYKLSSFGVSIEYILHGVGEMQRHTPVATLRDDEKAFLDIYNRVDDAVKLLLKVLLVQKFPK